jgi:hypothetical protein
MTGSCDCGAGDDDFYVAHNINVGDFEGVEKSQHIFPYSTEMWGNTSPQQANVARRNYEPTSGAYLIVSRYAGKADDIKPY